MKRPKVGDRYYCADAASIYYRQIVEIVAEPDFKTSWGVNSVWHKSITYPKSNTGPYFNGAHTTPVVRFWKYHFKNKKMAEILGLIEEDI